MFLLSCPLQITFLFSLVFALCDLIKREVPLYLFALFFAFALTFSILSKKSVDSILLGAIPGILLMVLSVLTKGQVGSGDAVYFIILSLIFTFAQILIILFTSWVSAGVISLFMIISGNKKSIPFLAFVPFPVMMLIIGGGR